MPRDITNILFFDLINIFISLVNSGIIGFNRYNSNMDIGYYVKDKSLRKLLVKKIRSNPSHLERKFYSDLTEKFLNQSGKGDVSINQAYKQSPGTVDGLVPVRISNGEPRVFDPGIRFARYELDRRLKASPAPDPYFISFHHINHDRTDSSHGNLYPCLTKEEHLNFHRQINRILKLLIDYEIIGFYPGDSSLRRREYIRPHFFVNEESLRSKIKKSST